MNRDVRVTPRVVSKGAEGYLEVDRNWLQIELTVANVGQRPVMVTGAQGLLPGGGIVSAARTSYELKKPPSNSAQVAGELGVGVGAMAVGMFIPFANLAILAGALGKGAYDRDKSAKLSAKFNEQTLMQTLPPASHVSGYIFLPASPSSKAILLNYSAGGAQETIQILSASEPQPIAPAPPVVTSATVSPMGTSTPPLAQRHRRRPVRKHAVNCVPTASHPCAKSSIVGR